MKASFGNRILNIVLLVLRVLLAGTVFLVPIALYFALMAVFHASGRTVLAVGVFVFPLLLLLTYMIHDSMQSHWGELSHTVHEWNGCTCRGCGKKRDEGHDWSGCKCRICGKTRDEGHDWDHCRCRVCGKKRDEEHDWDGCKCRICGKTRDAEHDWDGCKCRRCGSIRSEGHDWDGCICRICGSVRDEGHDWDRTHCRCRRCYQTDHKWVFVHEAERYDFPPGVDPCTENLCLMEAVGTTSLYRCEKCGETMEI